MSQHEVGSIEHLDFEVEEEKKEKEVHFAHPIETGLWWCGKKSGSTKVPGPEHGSISAEKINCVDCLHLLIDKGATWWWDVNRAWYGR